MSWGLLWVLSIIASTIAGAVRGAPGAGLFLGIVLGPVGAVIACFVSPMGKKRCSECREWVRQDASKCPHCRSDLVPLLKP